ncbi:MAG TPA: aspartate kinase, partial [Longimicrobiales bacterium]|nr:aspartate kinase [Longimicrobiales bacterium]
MPHVVLKFGGTSIAGPEQWRVVGDVVAQRLGEGLRPVVVHSALPGVTDLLSSLLDGGDTERDEGLATLSRRVWALASELDVREEVEADVGRELEQLRAALDGLPRGAPGRRDLGPEAWRRQAGVVASGERLVTPIAVACLRRRGLDAGSVQALELLPARRVAGREDGAAHVEAPRRWLSAECEADSDPELVERLDAFAHAVVVTQGFIARDPETGATALLGRGGSDTAAACLAGRLDARRLEVWSDVPGMFSADPRLVPGARLIPELDYAEAQEIATTGSRVLHPRCIPALRRRRIPIHLRSTRDPASPGTRILPDLPRSRTGLRAVSRKDRVLLLSIETVGMWQEVGFLARALGAIAAEGLSVDLVSTSETNVTVSLDGDANLIDRGTIDRLVSALREFSTVEVIPGCAAVSLVGRNVRRQLHRLGPILEAFEEHRIHMVTQAASDLNFTVVVDESQAGRLVERLHEVLVGGIGAWEAGTDATADAADPETDTDRVRRGVGRWWRTRFDELIDIAAEGPAYVYDLATVQARAAALTGLAEVDRVLYAMKANWNPDVLGTCRVAGTGFECVSPGELHHLESTFPDLDPSEVVFTPNFAARTEYRDALEHGYTVTLDALHPIEEWPELFEGREVFLRIDPGWGRGHHEKVVTGGRHSKFGIPQFELDRAVQALKGAGARVR